MEEDIVLLQDFINGKIEQDKLENYKGGYKLGFFYTKDLQQAIENLINRNKELQEERDNLIIQKNADYYKISKLKDDLDEVEGDRDYNYIPKSKVREKIEEYENKLKQPTIQNINIAAYGYYLGKKEGYEELLEERN